jgi:hypothetical protein
MKVREARKRSTLDHDPPLRITQILGEAALTREVVSPGVMGTQLEHLREMNQQDHIEIRVLPWRAGPHPALPSGAFTIMSLADAADPDIVYLESLTGATCGRTVGCGTCCRAVHPSRGASGDE